MTTPAMSDEGPTQLIVNYLAPCVTDAELRQLFSRIAAPRVARVVHDRRTGRSKGYGFVYFHSSKDAVAAHIALSGAALHGKRIKVSYAEPQRPLGPDGTPAIDFGRSGESDEGGAGSPLSPNSVPGWAHTHRGSHSLTSASTSMTASPGISGHSIVSGVPAAGGSGSGSATTPGAGSGTSPSTLFLPARPVQHVGPLVTAPSPAAAPTYITQQQQQPQVFVMPAQTTVAQSLPLQQLVAQPLAQPLAQPALTQLPSVQTLTAVQPQVQQVMLQTAPAPQTLVIPAGQQLVTLVSPPAQATVYQLP